MALKRARGCSSLAFSEGGRLLGNHGKASGSGLFRATPSEVARDRLRALASWKPEAIVAVGCAAALAFMLFGAVVAGGGR
jgi:hypothetical protein